ncbi:unnamed protein product [Mytilus coruscus]|uniref:C-type lectin domain-containing protein n=1 Tax=Mytilus coruscus TaxID=42192 RepID=A0A6J8A0V8_MYTCO|nr:unnamed protein product [Mytilus coruscus]
MSEDVELVKILQAEDCNKSDLQTREIIGTNVENDRLAEIRKAIRKTDKLICVLTVVLLVGFSLAVTAVVMHLKAYYMEKSSGLDKQIQQLALNTSGLERQVQTLSNQLGEKGPMGEKDGNGTKGSAGKIGNNRDVGKNGRKGIIGDKGAVGTKGPNGDKGAVGEKGHKGERGLTSLVGPTGSRGLPGEKGQTGDKGQNGENGLPGSNGEHGEKGIRGDKGLIGSKGPIGDKGQRGERGQKGEKGSRGESVISMRCGSGWEQLMNSCYYFQFQSKKTWNDAKIDCRKRGGFLVKIDNALENWFLKFLINKSAGDFWIGAHDSVREGRFKWEADNTPLTYTNWNPGEPNNAGNKEDCAYLLSGDTSKWNDAPCSYTIFYICEKH